MLTTLTEERYRQVNEEYNDIIEFIVEITYEFAKITEGREPKGCVDDTDFNEIDGCLEIWFEHDVYCGGTETSVYKVPLQFIFDEDYRATYSTIYEEKQKEIKKAKDIKRKIWLEEVNTRKEENERIEYNRLKAKYG